MDTVPWAVDNFEANVAAVVSKECGGKPVLILNDMVEQHYRKERIPKVSVMDKANVLQRKLMVAFPNYPVRAALPLKEKTGKGDKALPGSVYILRLSLIPTRSRKRWALRGVRLRLLLVSAFFPLRLRGWSRFSLRS